MARGDNRSTAGRPAAPARGGLLSGSADVVAPRLVLIVAVSALTVLGLVMVYSSSTIEAMSEGSSPTSYVTKQAAITLVSIAMCAFIARFVPYYIWLEHRWLNAFWMVIMLLLLGTALVGVVGLGAKRWIVIGPVNFQPSEFAKVAIVMMMARLLADYRNGEYSFEQFALRIGVLVVLPVGIILALQSDLGTTIICAVGILGVLWIGEVPVRLFFAIVIVVGLLGIVAIALAGYRGSRFAFLNPYADPYGSGYQIIHSFYAFGEGGLFGVGLGNSREKYLYLPEAETDFIFAIIGEEMGFAGAVFVIILFSAVLYAGLKIARNAPDLFGAMIAGGCTLMLVFQAFLNIGCVIGVFPTTGKPLPFISSGGSAMIGAYLLVGIVLSVSLASGDDSGVYDQRRVNLRVVRAERGSLDEPPRRSSSRTRPQPMSGAACAFESAAPIHAA